MDWILIAGFWSAAVLLFVSQVGYPAVSGLAALWRRSCGAASADEMLVGPKVSLVIPCHNEASVIQAKLENALSVDYPREKLEIIVGNDASSDESATIAERFEERGIRLLDFSHRRGKTSVVNDAVAAATGDLVCLCDANVMFRPDAVRRMVRRFQRPCVGAVTGDVRLASHESNFGEGERLYFRIERAIQTGESRLGSVMCVDGGMYMVRKELFQPLPPDTILDDFVTTMRIVRQGRRVVYEPGAIATENGTPTARQEFRRRVRVTAGAVQALRRGEVPSVDQSMESCQFVLHKLLRWLGPVWLAILFVTSGLLWDRGAVYQAAAGGQAVFYLLAGLASLSLRVRSTRPGGIAFYFVMSHAAMAVGLVKGLLNLQRVTWDRTERRTSQTEVGTSAIH